MDYLNADRSGAPIDVPVSDRLNLPGNWVTIAFDHKISDSAGHLGADGTTICNGARYAHGVLDLWLVGFGLGVEIQLRSFETDPSGNRLETHLPHEFYTSVDNSPVSDDGQPLYPRTTHHRWPVMAYVNSGHRLGIEIAQWPHDLSQPVGQIQKAQIQMNLW